MNDKEFSELQLRMMIVPRQVRWPAPEYLHWQRLHEAADEARERVSKAYTLMAEIDHNGDLCLEPGLRQHYCQRLKYLTFNPGLYKKFPS